jgi:two-component system, NarL family, response regulator
MESGSIRLIIADDHAVVREGIAAMLSRDAAVSVVAEAENGAQAIALYRQHRPDVVVMDVAMPGMSGIEAAEAIHHEFPQAQMLLLTVSEREEDVYHAFRAGAKAYLPKNVDGAELLAAVHTVAGGGSLISPAIAATLLHRVQSSALSPREREILQHVAEGETNARIGEKLFISEGTVKAHVNSILTKLGVADRTNAVTAAIRRGIIDV